MAARTSGGCPRTSSRMSPAVYLADTLACSATPCAPRPGSRASAVRRGYGVLPPILRHHASNQFAQLRVGSGPSWFAGEVPPVGAVCSSVQSDHGCGLDDRHGAGPLGPDLLQYHPKARSAATNLGRRLPRAATASCCRRARLSKTRACRDCPRARKPQRINLSIRSIARPCEIRLAMARHNGAVGLGMGFWRGTPSALAKQFIALMPHPDPASLQWFCHVRDATVVKTWRCAEPPRE